METGAKPVESAAKTVEPAAKPGTETAKTTTKPVEPSAKPGTETAKATAETIETSTKIAKATGKVLEPVTKPPTKIAKTTGKVLEPVTKPITKIAKTIAKTVEAVEKASRPVEARWRWLVVISVAKIWVVNIAWRDLCKRGRIERLGQSGRVHVRVGEREDQRVGNPIKAPINSVDPELLGRALHLKPAFVGEQVPEGRIVGDGCEVLHDAVISVAIVQYDAGVQQGLEYRAER